MVICNLLWINLYIATVIGIDGSLLNILSSYLSRRSQIMRINNSYSKAF